MTATIEAPVEVLGKRRFLRSVHLTRAIGILAIVGTHCWPDIPWTAAQMELLPLFFRSTTMILVFLSGFLFQYTIKNFRYLDHAPKRLKQIVIPYLITSIPALVTILFFQRRADVWPWLYEMPKLAQVGAFLITGKHMAHLWYIPVVILFILLSPVFYAIDRFNLYKIAFLISAVAATYYGRDCVYGLITVLGKAMFAVPSFIFGMFFSKYYKNNEYLLINNAWMYSFIAGATTCFFILFPHTNYHFLWIQKLALAVMFVCWLDLSAMQERSVYLLDLLARYSFPIFFIHGYAIHLYRFFVDDAAVMSVNSSLLLVKIPYLFLKMTVVLLLCLAATGVIRAMFGRNSRFLIGT